MTKEDYFQQLEKVFITGLELMKKKNQDYAGLEDPFKNFRLCESLGVTLEQGILVRMSDKLARISNLLQRPGVVPGESVGDTLQDLANYSAILMVWLKNKQEQAYQEKEKIV